MSIELDPFKEGVEDQLNQLSSIISDTLAIDYTRPETFAHLSEVDERINKIKKLITWRNQEAEVLFEEIERRCAAKIAKTDNVINELRAENTAFLLSGATRNSDAQLRLIQEENNKLKDQVAETKKKLRKTKPVIRDSGTGALLKFILLVVLPFIAGMYGFILPGSFDNGSLLTGTWLIDHTVIGILVAFISWYGFSVIGWFTMIFIAILTGIIQIIFFIFFKVETAESHQHVYSTDYFPN